MYTHCAAGIPPRGEFETVSHACDTSNLRVDESTSSIMFASIYHPLASFRVENLERDHLLPISTFHPAFVIGTKGPIRWAHDPEAAGRPTTLDACIDESFRHAKASLDVLYMAWQLKHEQAVLAQAFEESGSERAPNVGEESSVAPQEPTAAPPLPPWAFLIGIIYDAQSVIIVAHIPHRPRPVDPPPSHPLPYE